MMHKKLVFRQLCRCVCTRRIKFALQNLYVVSFFKIMITLFAALSAGAKTNLRCNFSIFIFNDFTERLDGCLNKCGCLVKLSILMSIMRKNSFFQSFRACTPTPSFLDQRLQYV